MQEIPYWERYMLTIREAAEYFHIGEKKIARPLSEFCHRNSVTLFFSGFMGLGMI